MLDGGKERRKMQWPDAPGTVNWTRGGGVPFDLGVVCEGVAKGRVGRGQRAVGPLGFGAAGPPPRVKAAGCL